MYKIACCFLLALGALSVTPGASAHQAQKALCKFNITVVHGGSTYVKRETRARLDPSTDCGVLAISSVAPAWGSVAEKTGASVTKVASVKQIYYVWGGEPGVDDLKDCVFVVGGVSPDGRLVLQNERVPRQPANTSCRAVRADIVQLWRDTLGAGLKAVSGGVGVKVGSE